MAPAQFGWAITSQVADQTRTNSAGNVEVGSLIYFQTNDGNSGVVFVADNLLSVKHVTQVVAAQAKLIDEVGRLQTANFGNG